MMDDQGRDVLNSAADVFTASGYFVKCSRCAAILPKTMGLPSSEHIWDGWDQDREPEIEVFIELPALSDGCPICVIEDHVAA